MEAFTPLSQASRGRLLKGPDKKKKIGTAGTYFLAQVEKVGIQTRGVLDQKSKINNGMLVLAARNSNVKAELSFERMGMNAN